MSNMVNNVYVPSQATGEAPTGYVAGFSETADFERLEDGMYPGVIAGYTVRKFSDYNDKTKLVEKAQFIIQVGEGGQTYYFRTKPMTPVVNEKSNFFIFLSGISGAGLDKIKEKYPVGVPLNNLIGIPVQAVVNTVTGKDGKEYGNLANVLKAKKGQKTPVAADAIPAYLMRGVVASQLADVLTVKEETVAAKAANFPQGLPGGLAQGERIDDRAPGLIVPGTPVVPQNKIPQVPANAKVTQNTNAQAFMNPQLQVTQPAPQPAPAVPAAEQAPDQGEDSDDDLPF